MKKLNGVHLRHDKGTQDCQTVHFPLPKQVVIPMSQSMGAPCNCLVKAGDTVKVGQKIGDTDAFMSAPVHSSVSGTVNSVIDFLLVSGAVCKAVVIDTDGEQTLDESIAPPVITDRDSFIAAVRESGLTGLGGAGFPTHIKLNFDAVKTPIDTLVINAAECEPYITSDYREMMENPLRRYRRYFGGTEISWHTLLQNMHRKQQAQRYRPYEEKDGGNKVH